MNRIKRIVGASVGAFLFVTILNAAHATGMRALFTLDIAEKMALACEMFSEQKGYRSEWHLPGFFLVAANTNVRSGARCSLAGWAERIL